MHSLTIKGKEYPLPIYFPDATRAVVKAVSTQDLLDTGVEGVVVNSLHISENPGLEVMGNFGGVKNFMNFQGLVASDSGGWQMYSLIHRSKNQGEITDEGVVFKNGTNRTSIYTPEDSIKTQFEINSDIVVVLDDFTEPDASEERIKDSVERTVKWAKRSKEEYLSQVKNRNLSKDEAPVLMAVNQGGWSKEYRLVCQTGLNEIGFDAYGYGGYAVSAEGELDLELSEYIANLIPNTSLKFALGVGKPWDIANLRKMGWDIFDCTLPTRDARHKRLYTFKHDPDKIKDFGNKENYEFIYINKAKYSLDHSPISEFCDCYTCKNYSKAYLHHLFKIKDNTALRLAIIHNLRHYTKLIQQLRLV